MFFLALSPTQVYLLVVHPELPLHSNMSLTMFPFYPGACNSLWICKHCRPYLKKSKDRTIESKQQRADANASAIITSVPHIYFPYKDLEKNLHTLDCSHHPCLRGPHITAHLPDQAQTTDGFRRDPCAAHTQAGESKILAGKPGLLPLHSKPAWTGKAPHLWSFWESTKQS